MIRNLFGGASKCRTIDVVDIFGDSSGVALYRLDGNANDTGGNYHGTEINVTYGGGVYERGAVFNNSRASSTPTSYITTPVLSLANFAISFYYKKAVTGTHGIAGKFVSTWTHAIIAYSDHIGIGIGGTVYNSSTYTDDLDFHHYTISRNGSTISFYKDGSFLSSVSAVSTTMEINVFGCYVNALSTTHANGSLDQVRIFNRAITATEVATLYAECEPTSTVSTAKSLLINDAIAHYKLDGNALDSMGNYNGTATAVTYVDSNFGQAGVFNGTSSKVSLGTSVISSYFSSNISISFWVNPSNSGASSANVSANPDNLRASPIFGKYDYTSPNGATGFLIGNMDNKIAITHGQSAYDGEAIATNNIVMPTGTWTYIVVSKTSSNTYSIYANGVLQTTYTVNASNGSYVNADSRNVVIGAVESTTYGGGTGYFNGSIDQFRIYDRALTQAEVTALYQEASPTSLVTNTNPFNDSSLKAMYRFENNANDELGVYNGTATNVTYSAGRFGDCAVFNGSSSKVDTNIASTSLTQFSTSVWFKANASTVGTIYQKSKTGLTYAFGGTAGVLQFEYFTSNWFSFNISNSCVLGTWYNVIITYDGTVIRAYLNGSLANSVTATHDATVVDIFIGSYQGTSSYFNGSIDQVRIFNRALTASEVQALASESSYPKVTLPTVELDPFLDNSCKALYKFDGNVLDSYDVYNGTATNVTYATGKFGQCAVFNGTSSIVKLDTWVYPLSMTTPFSFSCFVKIGAIPATRGVVFGKATRFLLSTSTVTDTINTANKLTFACANNSGTWNKCESNTTITLNQLYHVVCAWNGSKILMWIDGILQTSQTAFTTFSTTSGGDIGKEGIGASNVATPSGFLDGSIDQLRFFNKALTPMEVASLYNETTPMEEPMHSLVDPFKDGSGKALYRLDGNALDESGNYNGTATSVTYTSSSLGNRLGVFNGSTSVITSAYTATSPFTWSCWIVPNSISSTQFAMAIHRPSPLAQWYIGVSSGNIRIGTYDVSTKDKTIAGSNGLYYHCVLVSSGTSFRAFVNGVEIGTATACTTYTGTATLEIGRINGANYFNGWIDQVRIFNKELTETEIQTLYTKGA